MKREMETRASHESTINKSQTLEGDRLSNLPDELILRILSYVDTKLAVMTCVLSKRWRHLWEYLPVLNMYHKSFCNTQMFGNFISQFLENHKACSIYSLSLDKSTYSLSLDKSQELNELLISRVIEHVVSRHVQHVCLEESNILWRSKYYNFAFGLLSSSKSLVSLKLTNYYPHVTRSCLNLPSLKTLSLWHITFSNKVGGEEITTPLDVFSSCPSLENLELIECDLMCHGDFIISCPQVVNLKISNTWFLRSPARNRKMIISAPRLTYFKFEDRITMDLILSMDNSPCLHAVDFHTIYYPCNFQNGSQERKEEYLSKLVNLFKALRTAKSLSMSMETIQVLSFFSNKLEKQICPFDNLESVKLRVKEAEIGVKVPLEVNRYLLSGSPNVKGIVVEEDY